MSSGIGIKTIFREKIRDLDKALNTPSGIGDAEFQTIKTLFTDVLERPKGPLANIYEIIKELANQIMDRIPTIPSEETRQRLIGMLLTLNQDETPYLTQNTQSAVSLKGHVLTLTMMAHLNTLNKSRSSNPVEDSLAAVSAVDMESLLQRYVHHSPEAERVDRMAVAQHIRDNGGLTSDKPFAFSDLRTLVCFPEGFNPQGEVTVFNCPAFTGFPEGFVAQGPLKVDSCKSFTGFPKGFEAGDVHVHYCPSFTGFPEGFKSKGEVIVADCHAFTGFPKGVAARAVRVHYCPTFKGFPEGFSVCDIRVHYCPSFKGFSEGFASRCTIKIESCTSFTGFPEGFEAYGYVNVSHCPSFRGFPKACKLQCEVEVFNCKAFTDFPENSEISDLRIHNCPLFRGFPEACNFQGKVEIFDCKSFMGFPENSDISELLVFGCPSFRDELAS